MDLYQPVVALAQSDEAKSYVMNLYQPVVVLAQSDEAKSYVMNLCQPVVALAQSDGARSYLMDLYQPVVALAQSDEARSYVMVLYISPWYRWHRVTRPRCQEYWVRFQPMGSTLIFYHRNKMADVRKILR